MMFCMRLVKKFHKEERTMKKLLSVVLALAMLTSMTAAFAEAPAEVETPLVVAIQTLSSKFSPFFADTGYDQDVVEMTQVPLMTTDRTGAIIFNGIEGETLSYNGTDYNYQGIADLAQVYDAESDITTYTAKLREDIKFSDGTPMTADDVIFNYYVYLDPSYTGSTTLSSYDILGLQAYLTQVPEDSLASVVPAMDALKAAGAGYTVTEADPFTQEVYDAYQAGIVELWKADTQGITDYVFANYGADYSEAMLGKTADEVGASEGLKTSLGMALWGFGEISEDFATVTTAAIDNLQFQAPAYTGDMIVLRGMVTYVGRSSMEVRVDTYREALDGTREMINRAYMDMVCINCKGQPEEVPALAIETEEQKKEYEAAKKRKQIRKQRRTEGF